MEDWQTRVIAERQELGERVERLETFLSKGELGEAAADVLRRQHSAMVAYREILDQRIKGF